MTLFSSVRFSLPAFGGLCSALRSNFSPGARPPPRRRGAPATPRPRPPRPRPPRAPRRGFSQRPAAPRSFRRTRGPGAGAPGGRRASAASAAGARACAQLGAAAAPARPPARCPRRGRARVTCGAPGGLLLPPRHAARAAAAVASAAAGVRGARGRGAPGAGATPRRAQLRPRPRGLRAPGSGRAADRPPGCGRSARGLGAEPGVIPGAGRGRSGGRSEGRPAARAPCCRLPPPPRCCWRALCGRRCRRLRRRAGGLRAQLSRPSVLAVRGRGECSQCAGRGSLIVRQRGRCRLSFPSRTWSKRKKANKTAE